MELLADDTVLAADDNSLGATLGEGLFDTSTVTFTTGDAHALLGESLEIRLINLNIPGTANEPGIEVDFDLVRLDASPIPLPPAVVLLGAGVLSLIGFRRRRNAAS